MTDSPVRGTSLACDSVLVPRLLPIQGSVLVQVGEEVRPDQIVAEADLIPSVRWTVPVCEQLAITTAELPGLLLVRAGGRVQRGDVLAEAGGRPRRTCRSPVSGTVEQIDFLLGQLWVREAREQTPHPACVPVAELLACSRRDLPARIHRRAGEVVHRGELLAGSFPGPLVFAQATGTLQKVDYRTGEIVISPAQELWRLPAGVPGVVECITPHHGCILRCQAERLRGFCRIGGEAYGRLQTVGAASGRMVEPRQITAAMAGQVVVISSMLTGELLQRAQTNGVAAIIAGGAHLGDLMQAFGISRPALAMQTEPLGTSVLLLSRFGESHLAADLFAQFESLAGRHAFVSGQQPELLVLS